MNNIGNCVGCGRLFGFRISELLQGRSEGSPYEDGDNVVLPVSLGAGLLLIGGQLFGFSNPEVQELISEGSGPNITEFFGSRFCPMCFPSSDDVHDDEDDWGEDEDEDEYWDGDEDEDDDKPVKVLRVTAQGLVDTLVVRGLSDMKQQSEIDDDFDSSYVRDLGVYYWYDAYASNKKLPMNAFCSVLAGSCVRGTVVIIGDIKKDLTRSRDWEDLPNGWLDHRLARVINLVNTDERIHEILTNALQG
jgi:hypothetical protein